MFRPIDLSLVTFFQVQNDGRAHDSNLRPPSVLHAHAVPGRSRRVFQSRDLVYLCRRWSPQSHEFRVRRAPAWPPPFDRAFRHLVEPTSGVSGAYKVLYHLSHLALWVFVLGLMLFSKKIMSCIRFVTSLLDMSFGLKYIMLWRK